MIEITEIIRRAEQGKTYPYLCQADDGKFYYVKGKSASFRGLVCEWMGANLAFGLGLNVPSFEIVSVSKSLVKAAGEPVSRELGYGEWFASLFIPSAADFTYHLVRNTPLADQLGILLFDFWVRNEDRTLTGFGGNPNLLWANDKTIVIDHNLIFADNFDNQIFRETHVFSSVLNNLQSDKFYQLDYQKRLLVSLKEWRKAWQQIPDEWMEDLALNEDFLYNSLETEALGNIWKRLMQ